MRILLIAVFLLLVYICCRKIIPAHFKSQNIYINKTNGHVLKNSRDYTGLVKSYDSFLDKLQDIPIGCSYFHHGLYFGFSGSFTPLFKNPCPYIYTQNYQKGQFFILHSNYQRNVLYELCRDKILSFIKADLFKKGALINSPSALAQEIILFCEADRKTLLIKTMMFYANGVVMLIDVKNKQDTTLYNLIFDTLGTEFSEEHKFDFKNTSFLGYPDILELLEQKVNNHEK